MPCELALSPRSRGSSVDGQERPAKIRRTGEPRRPPSLLFSKSCESHGAANLADFKHLVVLGDSYSADTERNWIGYLLKKSARGSEVAVSNFARPGDTAQEDLELQLKLLFARVSSAQLIDGNALIVIWFGINDCGHAEEEELPDIVEKVFDAMHDLYTKWKARAFLLIDVPPMHRSPEGKDLDMDDDRYTTWNTELLTQAKIFADSTSKASVYVLSSYNIVSDFLDHPEINGLKDCIEEWESESEKDEDGSEKDEASGLDIDISKGRREDELKAIWEDDIHLSRYAHRLFADRVWQAFER